MKLTLKNIKVCKFASEETRCFEAVIYINGEKAASVTNDGHGGCDNVRHFDEKGRKLIEQFEAYCKTLPEYDSGLLMGDKPFMCQPDLESMVGDAVTSWELEKDFNRDSKKVMLLDAKGISRINMKAVELNEKTRAQIKKQWPAAEILNDMPTETAFTLFKKHVYGLAA